MLELSYYEEEKWAKQGTLPFQNAYMTQLSLESMYNNMITGRANSCEEKNHTILLISIKSQT